MAVVDRVRELVAPVVADVGAELYDVEFNGGILRILVDADGGIDIDAIKTLQPSKAPQFHIGLEEQDHGWFGASSRGSQNNQQTAKRSVDEESLCGMERGYQQDHRAQKRIVNP